MLAYADRYKCDRILMLYPFELANGLNSGAEHFLDYEGRLTSVLIGQVQLSDLKAVPGQLEVLFLKATKLPASMVCAAP